MEKADQTVDGLMIRPFGGIFAEDRIGIGSKRSRESLPRIYPEPRYRNANQYGHCCRGAEKHAPLPGRQQRHRKEHPKLWLIGETANENAGKHRLSL